MTTCTHLSDRMPEVAPGRARWSAEDERHLAACEDCRAEWAIVSAASRVGSRSRRRIRRGWPPEYWSACAPSRGASRRASRAGCSRAGGRGRGGAGGVGRAPRS